MKQPFFKNVYDSKLVDIWFNSVRNSLWTSAGILVATSTGNIIAWAFTAISYVLLATHVAHGTREPYEYLKTIYVYSNPNRFLSMLFDFILFNLRAVLMFIPIAIFWWTQMTGVVPF